MKSLNKVNLKKRTSETKTKKNKYKSMMIMFTHKKMNYVSRIKGTFKGNNF